MVRSPYYAVIRIFAVAEDHWDIIDGEAALHGREELTVLPLDRFCNAIVVWALDRVKDKADWLDTLNRPPGGTKATVTDEALEEDQRAFMAFAGALGIAPPLALSPAPPAESV